MQRGEVFDITGFEEEEKNLIPDCVVVFDRIFRQQNFDILSDIGGVIDRFNDSSRSALPSAEAT